MKFQCHVDIYAPIDKVLDLFDNPNNLQYWQQGFISYTSISGKPGTMDSKTRLRYKQGRNDIELIETILVDDLPQERKGLYVHKHMTNTMSNSFQDLGDGTTRYIAEVHYTEISHPIAKFISWIFPGLFKRQVQKWMDNFQKFVEGDLGNS